MQRKPFPFLIAVILLSNSVSGVAQTFVPKTIQFKGAPDYTDQELLDAIGLKKGKAITADEMKTHFNQLMDTGVFEKITYKFDGVDLVYSLTPVAPMCPIRLENLPLAPGMDLDAKLHARFPLYHGKVPSEGGLLESVRQSLEDMLAAQGIKAAVAATPMNDPRSQKSRPSASPLSLRLSLSETSTSIQPRRHWSPRQTRFLPTNPAPPITWKEARASLRRISATTIATRDTSKPTSTPLRKALPSSPLKRFVSRSCSPLRPARSTSSPASNSAPASSLPRRISTTSPTSTQATSPTASTSPRIGNTSPANTTTRDT